MITGMSVCFWYSMAGVLAGAYCTFLGWLSAREMSLSSDERNG